MERGVFETEMSCRGLRTIDVAGLSLDRISAFQI
jgi:hypothetical protein